MNTLLGAVYLGAVVSIICAPFHNRFAWALEQRRYRRRKA